MVYPLYNPIQLLNNILGGVSPSQDRDISLTHYISSSFRFFFFF